MRKTFICINVWLCFLVCSTVLSQTTAIRAGHIVDPASGTVSDNQIILIKDGTIRSIEITPLTLNEGNEKEYGNAIEFREKRGFSELARGVLASKILDRFKDLSAKYGTIVKIEGEKAIIKIRDLPTSKKVTRGKDWCLCPTFCLH